MIKKFFYRGKAKIDKSWCDFAAERKKKILFDRSNENGNEKWIGIESNPIIMCSLINKNKKNIFQ